MNSLTKFEQRSQRAGHAVNQRTVALDIETVSLSADEKGALSAIGGRIVCICLLIDDGKTVHEVAFASEDERQIISGFWKAIRPTDVLVGHNVLGFDLPFTR